MWTGARKSRLPQKKYSFIYCPRRNLKAIIDGICLATWPTDPLHTHSVTSGGVANGLLFKAQRSPDGELRRTKPVDTIRMIEVPSTQM